MLINSHAFFDTGPVERFITFLEMQGHSGHKLAENLLSFLAANDIGITDCRGQSYDNASNMSGKYNGMQAIIRQQGKLADYVPFAAHSLNLVGQSALAAASFLLDSSISFGGYPHFSLLRRIVGNFYMINLWTKAYQQ